MSLYLRWFCFHHGHIFVLLDKMGVKMCLLCERLADQ